MNEKQREIMVEFINGYGNLKGQLYVGRGAVEYQMAGLRRVISEEDIQKLYYSLCGMFESAWEAFRKKTKWELHILKTLSEPNMVDFRTRLAAAAEENS